MSILIILQIITIATTIITLLLGYLSKSLERRKDNKTTIFSKQLLNNLHTLRVNMSELLSLANPSSIREVIVFDKLGMEALNIYTLPVKFEEALSNIKAIFFPFYPQENNLIISLEKLKKCVMAYYKDAKNTAKCEKLKDQIRETYLEYAIYDNAMWNAISTQTTENNYSYYTFDEYYDKFTKDIDIDLLTDEMEEYTRKAQMETINESEIGDLLKIDTMLKGKDEILS